eukprot:CAMPEP_0167757170 /NCGR_PEP_ID=MMETSP0110_2-20121227/9780_1 /TAXON_ID=629695 /ORGANISM="Gymnochlora sp., Strain CCMP2014" /LENGTH=293 /DNA_ID=CAMNT_0007643337 /DNA_START=125 /DNA_END=1006 /DNA_ORIENTATION=-
MPTYNKKNAEQVTTVLFDYLSGETGMKTESKTTELSWDDFAKLCKAAGCDVVKTQRLWKQTDKDNSGFLDRIEFFQFCARTDIYPTVAKMAVEVHTREVEMRKRRMAADELFDFLDKSKDNLLSWEEFQPLCKGAGCSASQAREGWNVADTDESGMLDRQEFRSFVVSNTVWPVMKKLHIELQNIKRRKITDVSNAIFSELKRVKNNKNEFFEDELSFEQFATLCKAAGATSEEKSKELFNMTDEDRSGSISRKEFVYFCGRSDVWPVMEKIHAHILRKKRQKEESAMKEEKK